MSSPGRSWVRVLDIDSDDKWHEAEVGQILQAAGYALSRRPVPRLRRRWRAVRARRRRGASRARARDRRVAIRLTRSPARCSAARNAAVGKKMVLTWRMTDGAPQSLDYFGGSLSWSRPGPSPASCARSSSG